jgi:hypothetical protein
MQDQWMEDIIQVEDGGGRSISRAGSVARWWRMPRSQLMMTAEYDGCSARLIDILVVGPHLDANLEAHTIYKACAEMFYASHNASSQRQIHSSAREQ